MMSNPLSNLPSAAQIARSQPRQDKRSYLENVDKLNETILKLLSDFTDKDRDDLSLLKAAELFNQTYFMAARNNPDFAAKAKATSNFVKPIFKNHEISTAGKTNKFSENLANFSELSQALFKLSRPVLHGTLDKLSEDKANIADKAYSYMDDLNEKLLKENAARIDKSFNLLVNLFPNTFHKEDLSLVKVSLRRFLPNQTPLKSPYEARNLMSRLSKADK